MKKNNCSPLSLQELAISGSVAAFLLIFFGANIVLAWINQYTPLNSWSRIYSFPIVILLCLFCISFFRSCLKEYLFVCCISLFIIACVLYTSSFYLDYSFDGLAYHQRAVIALINGANFNTNLAVTQNVFLDNYAKATWFYAASIFSFFELSSLGTSYHWILGFASAFYLYRFCRWVGQKRSLSLIIAIAGLCNPIAISQSYTYYNDSPLGSLGIILFLAAIIISKENSSFDYFVFTICSILLINVKASGIIIIFCAFAYLSLVSFFKEKSIIYAFKKIITPLLIFSIFGVFILGYSPYTQNLIQGRHIFYPLAGKDAKDIMQENSPYGFPENNRFKNLFLSVFSEGSDLYAGNTKDQPKLKIPGSVTSRELNTYAGPDLRISGFGPVYSLSVVLAVIAISVLRINWRICGGLLFMLLLSIVINPHAWWARYSPTMWFIPLVPLIAADGFKANYARIIASLLTMSLFVNVVLISQRWLSYYPGWDFVTRKQVGEIMPFHLNVYTDAFATDLELISLGLDFTKVDQSYYLKNKERFHSLKRGIDYEIAKKSQ
ncbi:hypothetical protein [Comamonas piscis]